MREVLGGAKRFLFARSTDRQGGHLLAWGIGIFALVFVFFYVAYLWFPSIGSGRGAFTLIALPLMILGLSVMIGPTIFIVGYATGTPLISFAAGFRWVRRAWRGILGVILLISATVALLNEFVF